ncbi:MAG: 5-formyltetrahydrofolate cyclo-ligase [Candidatus Omnitrophota bacterium]
MIKKKKQDVRKAILTLLKNQKEEDRLRKSSAIRKALFQDPGFVHSKTVLFYASLAEEVETFEMIRQAMKEGKRVALPCISRQHKEIIPRLISNLEEDLEYGPYNIKQPRRTAHQQQLGLDKIHVVIVPAVAFDKKNNRLGRGAGYYDRLLQKLPSGIPQIGLAFDFQILETLPLEDHDFPVTRVITNELSQELSVP